MPRSKDPRRYGESYLAVLVEMETKAKIIRVGPFEAKKDAENFRLMLYGYAHAWEHQAKSYAKADPEKAATYATHAAAMSRYNLTIEGTTVVCRHNSSTAIPRIVSEGTIEDDVFDVPKKPDVDLSHLIPTPAPPTASRPFVEKAQMSQANKNFLNLLESVDKQEHEVHVGGPMETTREDIEGEDPDESNHDPT